MRTLKFIVNDLIITPDPDCDFNNLIPGTEGYLQAEFEFSEHWDGCRKVAAFWSNMGKEYPPQVLMDGKTCMIPRDALKRQIFKVQIVGKKNDLKLVTNKCPVRQDGGKI